MISPGCIAKKLAMNCQRIFPVVMLVLMMGACGGGSEDPAADNDGLTASPDVKMDPPGGSEEPRPKDPGDLPKGDVVGNEETGSGGAAAPNTECSTLPTTQVKVCTRASTACKTKGGTCPLFVIHNTNGPFDWIDTKGSMVVSRSYGTSDGDAVRHWMAEVASVSMASFPGIDPKRVFFVGWSAGAGAAYRGLCHMSKGGGISFLGPNVDIYAGVVATGGCVSCSEKWTHNSILHTLAINGENDNFAGDGCEAALRRMAQVNGCPGATSLDWKNVEAGDPLMSSGAGTDSARKLDFGTCPKGAVAGYRFKGEGHVLSFDKHLKPEVKAMEMVWAFLKDRRKN